MIREDLTGRRFGRWTVVSFSHLKNVSFWNCICDCGSKGKVCKGALISGGSKSCGCLVPEVSRKVNTTHGMRHTREYSIWSGIKERCYNKNSDCYYRYGGRGIKMCDNWINSFENFYKDMGNAPHGKSIDRINNDGNYELSNCRWATSKEQCNNRRSNVNLTIGEQAHNISEWSAISGIARSTICLRISRGWDAKSAIFAPIRTYGNFSKQQAWDGTPVQIEWEVNNAKEHSRS